MLTSGGSSPTTSTMSSAASPAIVAPSVSPTGAAIRAFQIQKGGTVANKESVDAQIAAKFGTGPTAKKAESEAAPQVEIEPIPFELEMQPVVLGAGKKGRRKSKVVEDGKPAQPTVLVQYEASLADGAPLMVFEYAYLAHRDGETLMLGFPLSNKTRLKPVRGSTIAIHVRKERLQCFVTGIHTDVPEWGVSMSLFLVLP